ncbi:MAG TPA: WecB/TagA/CpsF family glycosyltransferase [Candidatus Saccharimonadia bacterium]|jgi:N-acetylglucosaminyldiphosphoundecaprenol N-acetyl-beta-D-mannosaminyltransferase|nr:WecB/TagA/CpsF family glycosyltransferase [Candidatus Saccharimonadia bacterium]
MSKQTTYDKVELLNVEIDLLSLEEAINYICDAAARDRPAGYVIKPYVEFLTAAARHSDLQELLNGAELSIADGVAAQWAAHYLFAGPRSSRRFWLTLTQIAFAPAQIAWPVTERAAGTTFTWPLLHAAADRGLRVFLVGKEAPGDIEFVAATILRTLPNLRIVGTAAGRDLDSPYGHVGPEWIELLATRIKDSGGDLVLTGMGFPLQEKVNAELARRLSHGILIGEGGTFDYDSFGGPRRKAPAAIGRAGLEWLWRLVQEPRRLRRQLAVPYFIYLIWKSRR